MTTSNNSTQDGSVPDKDYLYGQYQKVADWKHDLQKKATYKALDVADDEMDFRQNIQRIQGLGWKELLVIIVGCLAAWGLWQFNTSPPPLTPSPSQPESSVPDSEYEVRFFDAEGNPIQIPHISEKP